MYPIRILLITVFASFLLGTIARGKTPQIDSLKVSVEIPSRADTTTVGLLNIAAIYTARGELAEAQNSLDQALATAQKSGCERDLYEVYLHFGALYAEQKKLSKAIDYGQQALRVAKKIASVDFQKNCQKWLAEIYAESGDFKEAYARHEQYKVLCDCIVNDAYVRKIALIDSTYQVAHEQDVMKIVGAGHALQTKNKQKIIVLLGLVLLLVVLLTATLYRSGRLRKRILWLEI